MTHTPTPWRSEPNSFGTMFIYTLTKNETAPMGFKMSTLVCGGDMPGTLTPANAAFIVRAVNSHDVLVKALEAAREYIYADALNFAPDAILAKIDAALAFPRPDGGGAA